MTSVAIIGAAGRMGQALVRCSRMMQNIRLAAAIDRWAKAGINLEYAYSATGPGAERSLIIAHVSDLPKALAALS